MTAPAWTPEREQAIRERLERLKLFPFRDDLAAALTEIERRGEALTKEKQENQEAWSVLRLKWKFERAGLRQRIAELEGWLAAEKAHARELRAEKDKRIAELEDERDVYKLRPEQTQEHITELEAANDRLRAEIASQGRSVAALVWSLDKAQTENEKLRQGAPKSEVV